MTASTPRSHTFNKAARARTGCCCGARWIEAGFAPYDNEWWHFTLRNERYPDRYFDFPVAGVGRRHLGLP